MVKFIDFCAGIGAGRLGLENNGFECIGFSEIDNFAELTYRKIFNNPSEENFGDLTKISTLPDFDLMICGFPCQTFSIIGNRSGLDDCNRGQIIYELAKIIKEKNIQYFILENVKGLINHNKGQTLKKILVLLESIGYSVYYKVLNSINFGTPQMRERIYFVGVRNNLIDKSSNITYKFPEGANYEYNISDFLCDDEDLYIDNNSNKHKTFLKYLKNKYNNNKYNLEGLLNKDYLILDTRQSDLRLYKNKVPTIRKGRQGILYVKNGRLKKLSGYEALLLQGFPKKYALKVKGEISNSNLLGQAGNAMTVNIITEIARTLKQYIQKGIK